MYHPTTRLLTILELLQTYPVLSGAELARRLEVGARSVRRYILMLQDMGIPIEATHGPGGGYQLRPGFKLPPLMFTDAEATAIVLGLLGSSWLELGQSAAAVEGALAKVLRVLPLHTRERLNAVSAHLILSPYEQESRPDAGLLLQLSAAIQNRQRLAFAYCSQRDELTQRTVEPYGLVGWWGRWYLVGFCCMRQAHRLFRLDRMQQAQVLAETFVRDEDFDAQAYVELHLNEGGALWQIEVEFHASLEKVRQKIPESFGTLIVTEAGVLFQSQYGDMDSTARYLMGLNLPFVVHQPPELRDALLRLAELMIHSASASEADAVTVS
ncbi:MAG: YafY family transcriptional regulator [Chloroflexi bacterium]|nr:YafY family transcriptional regulator [Chloroflexota bacterium]